MAGIKVENVVKRFGALTALNGVSFEVNDGEFFTILGPPGAGKTTTLRTIVGLERPDEGDVYVDGERITDVFTGDRDIAIMFQNLALYPDKSVYGNLEFPLKQRKVPKAEIFRQTGIQFMRFNSLYQILAMMRDRSPLVDHAETLLFIPDLFHYWMTGIKANEYTDASTSQMIDAGTRTWARPLIRAFGIPEKILGTLVQPGTVLGPLRPSVASFAGVTSIPVIAPATHDTAAAVAAVPAVGESWAYISSGTWSLMGVETKTPKTDEHTLRVNFTNEGGVGGTIRLLKNIMGLWLVQECRRAWQHAGVTYDYAALMKMAEASKPFASIINPDDASFMLPQSMPAAIADFCKKTGQPVPSEPGDVTRCALESLALRYRWVLERLEELVGRKLDTIHIVGGGCQNTLLCQLTADACNRQVVAGPVEATAIGNVLVQALGLGLLGSLAEGRAVVRRSFEVQAYEPREHERWAEPYRRFLEMVQ